jgi:hypothetical protein
MPAMLGVALGAAALEVDGEGEESVPPPLGHGSEELAGVAFGVPRAVGVVPEGSGLGVEVVEGALDEAGVREEALDLHAAPGPSGEGGPAAYGERVSVDADRRLACHGFSVPGPIRRT